MPETTEGELTSDMLDIYAESVRVQTLGGGDLCYIGDSVYRALIAQAREANALRAEVSHLTADGDKERLRGALRIREQDELKALAQCDEYAAEINALRTRSSELEGMLRDLTDACVREFGGPKDAPISVTLDLINRAKAALLGAKKEKP